MRYDKIVIRSWKDRPAVGAEATETELRELSAREEAKRRSLGELQEQIDLLDAPPAELIAQKKLIAEDLLGIVTRRQTVNRAEEEAAIAAVESSKRHQMVGKFGYQIIDGAMKVIAVVDDKGQPFPEEARFSCGVIEPNAPPPAWAKEQAAAKPRAIGH